MLLLQTCLLCLDPFRDCNPGKEASGGTWQYHRESGAGSGPTLGSSWKKRKKGWSAFRELWEQKPIVDQLLITPDEWLL